MEEKKQYLNVDDTKYETDIPESYTGKRMEEKSAPGDIRAVIPGAIVDVRVRKGQKVTAGDVVVVLEAMKMYNEIETESDGVVAEILVSRGDKVAKGQLIIRLS